MSREKTRKYMKTKYEGVFWRQSPKRDPRTGEPDRVYSFWYTDHTGKGCWKTVGRQSNGVNPATARNVRAKYLAEIAATGRSPDYQSKITVGKAVDAYASWAENERKSVANQYCQYIVHLKEKMHDLPIKDLTPGLLSAIKGELMKTQVAKRKKGPEIKTRKLLADETVNNILSFIRAAIYRAIGTGLWIGINPLATRRGGPWQMPKVNNARLRFFTPDEAKNLLAALNNEHPQLHDMASSLSELVFGQQKFSNSKVRTSMPTLMCST
jgi:hypothetical protein